jgi:hypothetical protein
METAKNIFLKVKVTNADTEAVYVHHRIPLEHVEMLRLNPNLKVEVLGRSRGARYEHKDRENSL